MKKDLNQNEAKSDTFEFFNYNRDVDISGNVNGENSHNKGLKSKDGKWKGTLRENNKASHTFSKITSITVMIGTVAGIIAGIATGYGVPIALLFIIPSFFIGAIISTIVKRRNS